ncbi:MAG TPA: tetratricopeptide repeat protein [Candidatus Competibacter sp.]|nr:tetratricopeptide repeat protein [Candidatus Competibacter sp.]
MEQYTDDERVEDLKKWWKENGTSIIVGIALGLIAIFGWQYWNSYRNAKAEQVSKAYDAFVAAAEKPDAEQARQSGQALLAEFPKSPYAALTALRLAKLALDGSDTATATQRLEWVIDNAKLDELKDIARLRLARLLFAAGRPEDAEQQLARVATASLTAEREELRGDLALAGNDPTKARTAYTAALTAGGGNSMLQLKLDNLAPPSTESVVVAPAAPPAATQPEPPKPSTPVEPAPAESAPASATPPAQLNAPTEPAAPAAPSDSSQMPAEAASPRAATEPTPAPSADTPPSPTAAETAPIPAPTSPPTSSGQ